MNTWWPPADAVRVATSAQSAPARPNRRCWGTTPRGSISVHPVAASNQPVPQPASAPSGASTTRSSSVS